MADISQFSIITYEPRPGHWRAAISPHAHAGIAVGGRASIGFVTPDDCATEREAVFAAEQAIKAL